MDDIPPQLFDAAGFAGVVFYILAYALLQGGVIRGTGYPYILMNLAAALLVLVSLWAAFNLSSAIIQVFWIAISLFGLARIYLLRRRTRFSPEEERLRDAVLTRMPRPVARRLLDLGQWVTVPAGQDLTTEGAPVETLYYILTGTAEARARGRLIGRVENGFVGEMNVLRAGAATAGVRTASDCLVLAIPGPALRRFCDRDGEAREHVEDAFNRDTHRKLEAANARLAALDAQA